MMDYIKYLSEDVLQDMLAAYIIRYGELVDEEVKTREFNNCRNLIVILEEEIKSRKKEAGTFSDLMMNN
jgi:hypothetical protein